MRRWWIFACVLAAMSGFSVAGAAETGWFGKIAGGELAAGKVCSAQQNAPRTAAEDRDGVASGPRFLWSLRRKDDFRRKTATARV